MRLKSGRGEYIGMSENDGVVPRTRSTSYLEWLLFLTKTAQRANYLGAVYTTLKTKSIYIQQISYIDLHVNE